MLMKKRFDPSDADTDGIAADLPIAGSDDDGIATLTEDGTSYDAETTGWDETEVDEGVPRRLIVTTTGDDSSKTITLTGTDADGEEYSETIAMANAGVTRTEGRFATVTSAETSAEPADAFSIGWEVSWWDAETGAEWIRSAVPDGLAHQLCVVSGHNDDENKTVTLHGFDADGWPITDTLALGQAAAVTESVKYFSSITHATASEALAGVLDIGWVDEFVSETFDLDFRLNAPSRWFGDVTGTINWSVDFAIEEPRLQQRQDLVNWKNPSSSLESETADSSGFVEVGAGYTAARLRVASYTNTAELTLYAVQPERCC